MPRTKLLSSSSQSKSVTYTAEQKAETEKLLQAWKEDYELLLQDFEESRAADIDRIKRLILLEKQNCLSSIGNTTLKDLKNSDNTTFSKIVSSLNVFSSTQISNINNSCMNSTKSIKKTNLKKSKHSDEGYITAESTRAVSSDRTRGHSPSHTDYKCRHSRSLSRSKLPKNVTIQLPSPPERKGTPERRMPPAGCYGYVTPKAKPNIPLTVLRRPKQGEMAISMQGSPLLVNGIITESCANINIPLEDGRIISLQPSKNIRMSQLPDIPDNTREQLVKLRDHLNKVCEYTK